MSIDLIFEKKTRYIVAISGFLITLLLGVLYAWGVFVNPLEQEFGWTRAQATLPYTIASIVFAIGMVLAGFIQDKKGPRFVALLGGLFAGLGFIISYFTNSLIFLTTIFGILGGFGMALGYSGAVSSGVKCFPDKKGLATGLVVGGFGFGAFLWAPLSTYLIHKFGWRNTFLFLGLILIIVISIVANFLRIPPKGWIPSSFEKNIEKKYSPEYTGKDFTLNQMLKTRVFWLMWIHYILATSPGIMIIVHLNPIAVEYGGFKPLAASFLLSILSIFNLIGRFFLGPLSDKIGRLKTFTLIGSLVLASMILLFIAHYLNILFYIVPIIAGIAYGGYLALSPSFTADVFGTKYYGVNYGAMFTAWGVAGILGPYLAGFLHDLTKSYFLTILIFSIFALIAVGISLYVRRSGLIKKL
jgi:OFA family oxalate/formate antiporter-like MFS transporter